MARAYRDEAYPALFLLEAWREMGGRVIITSDAHRREHILFGYARAVELAKRAGFGSCAVLSLKGIRDCGI